MLLAVLAFIPIGSQLIKITSQSTLATQRQFGQADNIARAGLIDAVSWFKRQAVQPVRSSVDPVAYPYVDAAFYPRTSTSDTIDESIGLVKEYPLGESSFLWGRYEVRRQKNTATNPVDVHAVHDITENRVSGFSNGSGLAWSIESFGFVYQRKNSSVAYNVAPNQIVARSRAAVEIRRLALNMPANAAAIVTNRTLVTVNSNGKITGNNDVGLGYYTGGSGPTISGSGAQVVGTPQKTDIDGATNGAITPQIIFGVTKTELKLMSDTIVNSVSGLPSEYPAMSVVYISSAATFDVSRPLRGGGILYVDGNLTLSAGGNTLFGGLIYVAGNLTINGPALISGAVVAEGSLTLNGAGDVAQVEFDNSILNSVRQQVAQYRENKSTYYSFQLDK